MERKISEDQQQVVGVHMIMCMTMGIGMDEEAQ